MDVESDHLLAIGGVVEVLEEEKQLQSNTTKEDGEMHLPLTYSRPLVDYQALVGLCQTLCLVLWVFLCQPTFPLAHMSSR